MANEDVLYLTDRTGERTDLVVHGLPTIEHDVERQFIGLSQLASYAADASS